MPVQHAQTGGHHFVVAGVRVLGLVEPANQAAGFCFLRRLALNFGRLRLRLRHVGLRGGGVVGQIAARDRILVLKVRDLRALVLRILGELRHLKLRFPPARRYSRQVFINAGDGGQRPRVAAEKLVLRDGELPELRGRYAHRLVAD